MTASEIDGDVRLSHEKARAYRQAALQMSVRAQAECLDRDLAAHRRLIEAGDPRAQGAALTAAHATLVLASSVVAAEADRSLRRAALGAALPPLARAGLGHLTGLVEAALAHNTDPAVQALGVERPQ